jgi:hypothetical protein
VNAPIIAIETVMVGLLVTACTKLPPVETLDLDDEVVAALAESLARLERE